MVLEEQGKKLVIDPGEFTPEFGDASNIVAVVVTHVHGDHLNIEHLQTITAHSPDVTIFTTAETAKEWGDTRIQIVRNNETQVVGPFTLDFRGELHNAVHPEWPQNQNIGVLVNHTFYYPGDSFTLPQREIKVLAVPAGAPWMKTGEAIDFLQTVNPKLFFRTHDGLWNEKGLATTDRWFAMASEKFGPQYRALNPDDSIEI